MNLTRTPLISKTRFPGMPLQDLSLLNQTQSSKHSGIMSATKSQKNKKLVPLYVPEKGSTDWLNVLTGSAHSCQLITSIGERFIKDKEPGSKDLTSCLNKGILYNHRSANLAIRFSSFELNSWIEIEMNIFRSIEKDLINVLHKSSLRFFFWQTVFSINN